MKKKPQIKSSRTVYQGYIDLIEDELISKTGESIAFNVIKIPSPAVAILAETSDQTLLVTREYRHGIGDEVISLPGGNMDEGEDPITAGKRELLEETGFEASAWKNLGSFYPCPALINQKVHLLFAQDARRIAFPHLETTEWIESELKTYEALADEIKDGLPVDSVLLALLYHYSIQYTV